MSRIKTTKPEDLFETPELWPAELTAALAPWAGLDELEYNQLHEMLDAAERVGYTFEYYLDAIPFGLRKMDTNNFVVMSVQDFHGEEYDLILAGKRYELWRNGIYTQQAISSHGVTPGEALNTLTRLYSEAQEAERAFFRSHPELNP